ncbi:MAG: hypothetical protein WC188_12315 [Candidatus Caldatribacteriota bacterium]|nr:hypothetical protein [Patescibacteria group bacterium]
MNVPTCCQKQELEEIGYDIYPDDIEGVITTNQFICVNCKTYFDKMYLANSNQFKWVKLKKEKT